MYQIKIKTNNKTLYYAGEGEGYYKASNQYQVLGSHNAWKGELGVRAFAQSGLSVYDMSEDESNAVKLSKRSIAEIVIGIMDRQQYGFLPKGNIEIKEVKE